MARVHFTAHLRRFFPDLQETDVAATTVADILPALEATYPGISGYIVDDQGALRKHVNIFVDGTNIRDRRTLSDALSPSSDVHIIQALSGG